MYTVRLAAVGVGLGALLWGIGAGAAEPESDTALESGAATAEISEAERKWASIRDGVFADPAEWEARFDGLDPGEEDEVRALRRLVRSQVKLLEGLDLGDPWGESRLACLAEVHEVVVLASQDLEAGLTSYIRGRRSPNAEEALRDGRSKLREYWTLRDEVDCSTAGEVEAFRKTRERETGLPFRSVSGRRLAYDYVASGEEIRYEDNAMRVDGDTTYELWEWDDPLLPTDLTNRMNMANFSLGWEGMVIVSSLLFEDPEGYWTGTGRGNTYVLTGHGVYEGLSAVLTTSADTEADTLTAKGTIYAGPLPSMPEPPQPAFAATANADGPSPDPTDEPTLEPTDEPTREPPAEPAGSDAALAAAEDSANRADNLRTVEPGVALDYYREAWAEIERARDVGLSTSAFDALETRVHAGLDAFYVVRTPDIQKIASLPDGSDPIGLVEGPRGGAFYIDRGASTMVRANLENGNVTTIVREGDKPSGSVTAIAGPVQLAAAGADIIIVDDQARPGQWKPSNAAGAGKLKKLKLQGRTGFELDHGDVEAYEPPGQVGYRLYVADPSLNQVMRYQRTLDGGAFAPPTSYLASPDAAVADFEQLYIDPDIYALIDDALRRYQFGKYDGAFALEAPPDDGDLRPGHDYRLLDGAGPASSGGRVYLYDSLHSRVVGFDKLDGAYVGQWLSPRAGTEMDDMRGMYVIDGGVDKKGRRRNDTLVWVTPEGVFKAKLATRGAVASGDVVEFVIEPGQTVDAIEENLIEAGLLVDVEAFRQLMIEGQVDELIKPGSYTMNTLMTPRQIVDLLAQEPEPPVVVVNPSGTSFDYTCEDGAIKDLSRGRWFLSGVEVGARDRYDRVTWRLSRAGKNKSTRATTVTMQWTTPGEVTKRFGIPEVRGDGAIVVTFDGPVDIAFDMADKADQLEREGIDQIRELRLFEHDGRVHTILGLEGDSCARMTSVGWARKSEKKNARVELDIERS